MVNEFEYDWCRSALDAVKSRKKTLAGTRWLILGGDAEPLRDAVLRFLEYADRELSLGLSLAASEDGILPQQADYCVYIEYTTARRGAAPQERKAFRQKTKATRRCLCVSNGGYGPYPHPAAAAEGEFRLGHGDPACELEALALENRGDAVLLRPGVILAPGLGLDSPVTELLDRLAQGESPCRLEARSRYTMVYMADFLTALVMAAADPGFSGPYNIGSPETTASLLRVCDLFCQTEKAPALQAVPEGENRALSCGRLLSMGWRPGTDLQTMIALEVLSRRGEQPLWIPGGHDGKLEIIHAELLKILTEIDRICQKHGIRYFLAGGTLLGAVRHQGFIPWDDDLDIMMLRRDHDRFLAVARRELPEHLFLQTPETDPGCHYLISKVRLSGTVFSSELLQRFPELHRGIFVDIIAQDYTANSSVGQKLHLKLSLLARGLVYKKWIGQSAASVKKGYALFDAVKGLLPMAALERFQRWALTLFDQKPRRRYLYDSMGINISRGAYPARFLEETAELPFEGRMFPVPGDYHGYLTYLYGDYMQPVPVSRRRIVHTVPQLDLGIYAAGRHDGCHQDTEHTLSSMG